MKKRFFALIALTVLVLSISAQAVELRTVSVKPGLYFSGTTATCSVICRGAGSDDALDVTLTLYQGSTYIDSWSDTGTGRVALTGSCTVERGKTYKLVVDYSVNDEAKPSVYTTAKCP
ncbi:hypothetical protein AALC17_04290 [Oscillospiraceae bacterium 38-13]